MAGCWCHYPSRWGNFSMPLWTQQYCSITVQQYVIVLRSTMLTLCIRSTAYSSWSFSHCHTKILNQRASQCILDARWYSVPPRVTGPEMAIFVVTGNLSFRTSFDEAPHRPPCPWATQISNQSGRKRLMTSIGCIASMGGGSWHEYPSGAHLFWTRGISTRKRTRGVLYEWREGDRGRDPDCARG